MQVFHSHTVDRVRSLLFGGRTRYGLIFTTVLYALLIAIGFVYLYPLLFMFITSMKSPTDLLNPLVQWVPTEFYTGNYVKAFRVLNYPNALVASILLSVAPSLLQTFVAADSVQLFIIMDKIHHYLCGRSSSAWAKKAAALRRISLARCSSLFSRSSCLIRS